MYVIRMCYEIDCIYHEHDEHPLICCLEYSGTIVEIYMYIIDMWLYAFGKYTYSQLKNAIKYKYMYI